MALPLPVQRTSLALAGSRRFGAYYLAARRRRRRQAATTTGDTLREDGAPALREDNTPEARE